MKVNCAYQVIQNRIALDCPHDFYTAGWDQALVSYGPWLLIGSGLLLALLYGSLFIVHQQSRAIIERFGRYHRTASPGLRIKIPLVDQIASRRWLRIEQMIVTVDTKTKDNVFVKILVAVQYRVIAEKAMESWYQLEDDKAQIQAFVLDVVRAKVPNMELDHVFEKKDEVAQAVKVELTEKMSEFGFEISSALVTDVDPAANVKAAMNEIQTQRRLQEAASAKGEAEKILTVKNAEAEAESKRLQGEGIAKQRIAIAQGLRDSVKMVADAAGVNPSEVLQTLLLTQYFDTMKEIGVSAGSKVILIPHSAGGMNDVAMQIRDSMIAAEEISRTTRK
jgi:regulator of protease activity HflC (stomatin/prohibitin superfamily)